MCEGLKDIFAPVNLGLVLEHLLVLRCNGDACEFLQVDPGRWALQNLRR